MKTSKAFGDFIIKAPFFSFFLIATSIIGTTYIITGLFLNGPIAIQSIVGGITFGAAIVLGQHHRERIKNEAEI